MLAEIIQQAEAIAAQDSWLGRSQVWVCCFDNKQAARFQQL
jgi:hypothetical protein